MDLIKAANSEPFRRFRGSSSLQLIVIAALNLVAAAIAFLTSILAAGWFGIGSDLDSYYAALTIPTLLIILLGVDYFGTNFFPVYSRLRKERGIAAANELINSLINSITLVIGVLAGASFVFAGFLHRVLLPGLSPSINDSVTTLFRIIVPIVIFQVPTVFIGYVLQYENKIIQSQISAVINASIALFALLFFWQKLGIQSLALGILAGNAVSMVSLALISEGYSFKPVMNLRDSNCHKVITSSLIMTGSGMIARLTTLVERYFASFFPAGSFASLGFAYKLISVPASMIITPLNTVMYAKMTQADSGNDNKACAHIWQKYIIFAFMVMIPLAMLIVYLSKDIMQLVLQRNKVTPGMSAQVALAFAGYSGVFLFGGIGTMLTRVYYLKNKIIIPAVYSVAGFFMYIALATLFTRLWGFIGLPLAMSVLFVICGLLILHMSKSILAEINTGIFYRNIGIITVFSIASITAAALFTEYLSLHSGIPKICSVLLVSLPLYAILMFTANKSLILEVMPRFGAK
ncbi:MAG: hypothetical protein HY796_05620 [Elusimicrobia bacterium]|nr:hypothetical protein [Elusimicrobiota bacterium]